MLISAYVDRDAASGLGRCVRGTRLYDCHKAGVPATKRTFKVQYYPTLAERVLHYPKKSIFHDFSRFLTNTYEHESVYHQLKKSFLNEN